MFHKGYVTTQNKKCIEKFKNKNDLKSYDQIQQYPEFAGVLSEDAILIDVDDADQAEVLMTIVEDLQLNCRVYQTSRGKHFLFKNSSGQVQKCFTHTSLAVGLYADIKVGLKNSYQVLKYNGEERFVEWDIEPNEEYQEIPKWLFPIKANVDFLNLEAGDGRNQALFNYILTLQANDFSIDEARETIRIINKYILKEPLSDDELEVILRDEAFSSDNFLKNGQFQHSKFAVFLKNHLHIKRINGQLHIFKDGCYVSGYRYIENQMIKILPESKANQRMEVLKYLEVLIPDNESVSAYENMIAFRNGIYDRKKDQLIPFNPEYIVMNKIPWDYNPNAYDELTDQTLNKISCYDSEIRFLLEEMIGYCLYRKNNLQKSFILTGSGANGKSTFLEVLKSLLGEQNISQLDIGEIDDRFSTVMLSGKLANIGDDISSDILEGRTFAVFKKTVTGNGLKGENKGQDAFFFKPYCKLVFSANNIPRMKSKGFEAIKRRILIVPFAAHFDKNSPDFDKDIEDKLKSQDSIEYLIQLGLQGLTRALDNKGFTESKKVQQEVDDFEKDNDPLLSWISTMEDEEYLFRETVQTIYTNYSIHCEECGFRPLALNVFSRDLQKLKGLESYRKTINGKTVKMFRTIK